MVAKRRPPRPRFRFSDVGIPVGEILSSRYDDSVRCEVVRDNDVKFEEKEIKFKEATRQMLMREGKTWIKKYSKSICPKDHWKYEGKPLTAFYDKRYPKESEMRQEGEEVIPEGAPEGAVLERRVNRYERDPELREEAIRIHGVNCFGCGINMKEMYGLSKDFIHIHHLKPLSTVRGGRVSPEEDLRPLCPNCHAVVHLEPKTPPVPIAKLKGMIKNKC